MKPILINLDLRLNNYEEIELKQGCQDTLIATITDLGDVVDLTGQVISVEMLKGDNTFIIQTNDITVSTNKITIILNKDLTRVSGKGKLQIKMAKDNIISGSWVVSTKIKKGAIDSAIGESGNIVTIKEELDKSITKATEENKKTQDLIQNGGAATKGQVEEISSQLADIVHIVRERINVETDDTNALKEATNSNSKTILLTRSNFVVSDSIIVKSNQTVDSNCNSIIKLSNGINKPIFTNNDWNNYGTDKNITLKNIILDGNKTNQSLKEDSNSPIYFKGVDCLKIINVSVVNGYFANIFINNSKKIDIEKCIASNSCVHGGIVVSGDNTFYDYARISQCICSFNNIDGILAVQNNIKVEHCESYNNGICAFPGDLPSAGIFLGLKSNNCTIEFCKTYNNSGFGIENRDGKCNMISKNQSYLNGLAGIICHGETQNNTVDNNKSYNNSNGGVDTDNYGGIFVGGFTNTPESIALRFNNIITNNKCYDDRTVKKQRYGIACINANTNIIADNLCTNSTKSDYLINYNSSSIIRGTGSDKVGKTNYNITSGGHFMQVDIASARAELKCNKNYLDLLRNDGKPLTVVMATSMGTTVQRPTNAVDGQLYIDQTIKKLIVCYGGGNRWVDASNLDNVV